MASSPERRKQICQTYGLVSELQVYQMIAEAAKSGIGKLLRQGLRASALTELGYDLANMRRLGFNDTALRDLGYIAKDAAPVSSRGSSLPRYMEGDNEVAHVRQMLDAGSSYGQFREKGYTAHHLKKAGCIIPDLERLGFPLDDLVQSFSAAELRRAGYNVRDLKRFFNGEELRRAGFAAVDMRLAGFGIKELLNFGYNENHVRTAGYSIVELTRAGLTRQTVDKTRFQ